VERLADLRDLECRAYVNADPNTALDYEVTLEEIGQSGFANPDQVRLCAIGSTEKSVTTRAMPQSGKFLVDLIPSQNL
jgi:hypothetical protein